MPFKYSHIYRYSTRTYKVHELIKSLMHSECVVCIHVRSQWMCATAICIKSTTQRSQIRVLTEREREGDRESGERGGASEGHMANGP